MMGEMVVMQSATELSVTRGQRTLTYKLDGSESTNPGGRGGEVKSKARVEGATIVIESSQMMGEMSMTTKETWSMDGSSLVITSVRSTPNGERTTKMVYEKQ